MEMFGPCNNDNGNLQLRSCYRGKFKGGGILKVFELDM